MDNNQGHELLLSQYLDGKYLDVICSPAGQTVIQSFLAALEVQNPSGGSGTHTGLETNVLLLVGLAALDSFLQANVTGPVPDTSALSKTPFGGQDVAASLPKWCLAWLEVDGVSPYPFVPLVELFCLARHALMGLQSIESVFSAPGLKVSPTWIRLRINTWHYKLLSQPSLGASSVFTRSAAWSDVPTLVSTLVDGTGALNAQIVSGGRDDDAWAVGPADEWSRDERALCLVELANINIMLGREEPARGLLGAAVRTTGLEYALSGALGKRTRFQEKDISQLVALASSREEAATCGDAGAATADASEGPKPDALPLNDDTLLEEIAYKQHDAADGQDGGLPPSLSRLALAPGDQPRLTPVDQIILLTEATLRDSFSPADTLTSAEVLPYAVRVLADGSTNWQIYTQALLVRSRIEVHRSRTVERGILQMQAVVDQVIVDTASSLRGVTASEEEEKSKSKDASSIPTLSVTAPDARPAPPPSHTKATSFLPAARPEESAPAAARLQYIHALSSPPRWHLESELGYAWAHMGSLVSALDIFKRLHLWAEVALCLASAAAAEDESGRGAGGEVKARAVVRWRLFTRTGTPSSVPDRCPEPEDDVPADVDPTTLVPSAFAGPLRVPPPPNAARLLCILGDLELDPAHYERAWEVSRGRYARAQKSLGDHHLRRREWDSATNAYRLAVRANRLSGPLWTLLGDCHLRLGQFAAAAGAYGRAVAVGDAQSDAEHAKTWSNLGSALWSLYSERIEEGKREIRSAGGGVDEPAMAEVNDAEGAREGVNTEDSKEEGLEDANEGDLEPEPGEDYALPVRHKAPDAFLPQALSAYKRGAAVGHSSDWRIWDNVLTVASRMRPPAHRDMVLAARQIVQIRRSEGALDAEVLGALLRDTVLTQDPPPTAESLPARGTIARAVVDLVETDVVPLITQNAGLWELVWRERAWRGDFAGAVDAAEKAWRTELGGPGGTLGGGGGAAGDGQGWLVDVGAWHRLVGRTGDLVAVLENWGSKTEALGGGRWKIRARSAVRSVMGKGRAAWEGAGDDWKALEEMMSGLAK